ncbi:hypothetical protein FJT64_024675 [Amphibalanus amphitrite]|uniref:Uncharacterized protein n=1 Tax=Amphibalanus amphitrite TaxID=1232801 RepID=A0A6A4WHM6_AMPAM|nr:hypothetical protein FJT64_024675 [Amphibalanus amphitrite]
MHSNDVLDNAVKEFFITVKRKDGERYKSKSLHTLNSILLSLPNVLHAGSDIGCNYLFNLRNFAEPLDKLALNFTTDDNHPLFSVEKDLSQTNGGVSVLNTHWGKVMAEFMVLK